MSEDTRQKRGSVDAQRLALPATWVAAIALAVAGAAGAGYVVQDKVHAHDEKLADHEHRLQTTEKDAAVQVERLDRLVRGMERLEDRFGTKPAGERP